MTGNPFPDGYDGPLSALRNNVEDLAVALAIWEARDDTRPDAHARRCANDAVDAIDAIPGRAPRDAGLADQRDSRQR